MAQSTDLRQRVKNILRKHPEITTAAEVCRALNIPTSRRGAVWQHMEALGVVTAKPQTPEQVERTERRKEQWTDQARVDLARLAAEEISEIDMNLEGIDPREDERAALDLLKRNVIIKLANPARLGAASLGELTRTLKTLHEIQHPPGAPSVNVQVAQSQGMVVTTATRDMSDEDLDKVIANGLNSRFVES